MKQSTGWKLAGASMLLTLCSFTAAGTAVAQAPDAAPPAPSQDGPHGQWRGRQDPQRQLTMLTHLLNLTPDQQKGVKTVLDQQTAEMEALRAKAPADPNTGQTAETREARMAQVKQIRDESNTKISALLDENQKKTFADWVQRREAMMARRQGANGQGASPDGAAPPPPPPNE